MKYFLLDDDIHFHNQFKKILRLKNINIDIAFFTECSKFLEYFEKVESSCNILFLDIDMPEYDGITFARKLYSNSSNLIIIFLTNRTDLISNAFGINVFKFISKSDFESTIESVMLEVRQLISVSEKVYFGENSNKITVNVREILYFERVNRKSWIVLKNDERICLNYLTMDYIYEKMNHNLFAYINRGQIVNLFNIKRIESNALTLTNESILYSSIVRKNEVIEKYKGILFTSF